MDRRIISGLKVKVHTGEYRPPITGRISIIRENKIHVALDKPSNMELSGKITVELNVDTDAAHLFTAGIESVLKLGDTTLVLQELSEVYRQQRREFVRVPTSIDVKCHNVKYDRKIKSVILNISGKGALLCTREPLRTGDIVKLKFTLPVQEKFNLQVDGRVVREAEEAVDGTPWDYKYGIEFVRIPATQQDKIISYVFRELTKRRKKQKESSFK